MNKIFLITSLAICLIACKSTVKEAVTCTGIDWYKLGVTTAAQGKSVRTFNRYRDNCGDSLDKDAMPLYLEGYSKSIIQYCTFDNGYQLGNTGSENPNICPTELTEKFDKGFQKGLHDLTLLKDQLKNESERRHIEPETSKIQTSDQTH
jgi:hypothetical protein